MNRPPRWRRRLGALALMPVLAVLAPAALAASDTPGDYSQRWPLTLP